MLKRLMVAAALMLAAGAAMGQSYPVRPLRLIVPFTPAGATDMLARLIGEALGKRLGQPLVVENRPGAGGNLGAQLAAKAPADGYTLLMAPSSIYCIATTLYREPGYDLMRDFAPVSTVANVPHVLVVNASVPAKNLKELLALARESELALASQGTGTVSHLEGEMLQHMANVRFVHVPYKGSSPALIDLIAGRVQLMFDSVASAMPQIKAGKLRALAVTGDVRASVLPQVPTMSEAGVAGYRAESWLGIMLPAHTPLPIVARLNRELVAALSDPKIRQVLVERGFEPQASSPDQYVSRIRADLVAWSAIVKASGASIE